jgi:hypothetical protein
MNSKLQIFTAGMLLATIGTGLGQQPIITQQPQSCTNLGGTTATFMVEAIGTPPLAYQWQWGGFSGFYNLTDRTNTTLVLTNVGSSDAMDYRVVVTNVDGAITSDVATLTVLSPPVIINQPTNWPSLSLGASVTNRVLASGDAPLRYQWCFKGAPLPGQTKTSIILTNVQLSDAGDYTAVVTNLVGSVTSRVVTLTVDPTFTKITTGVIVTDAEASVTGNWVDYDNDGYPDLLVANFGSGTTHNTLYHNDGGTNFTRVAASPCTTDSMRSWGAAWVDYDNDGNVDLMVANLQGGINAQRLYRNNGDGTFTAVVDPALRSDTTGATCPWWIDYDNDGFLDLFMAKGWDGLGVANNCLFRNNGDGTFKKMTTAEIGPILNDQGYHWHCSSADYDNDGRQELAVFVVQGALWTDFTWRRQADGSFVKTTPIGIIISGMYRSWGDYNNDGLLDAFTMASDGRPALYRNLGSGQFANVTGALRVTTALYMNHQASWGDYDNDGWLDIYYTGWDTSLNGLFHNNGNGTFTQILTGSPVYDLGHRKIPSWVDYDNDGFLDLFIAVGDAVPEKNLLYRNNGNSNHWLKVKLDGRASNRSGIGARVRVNATIAGTNFWQMREISCANDGAAQNGLLAHFGLGDATNVTTVRIEWPSGIVQELTNVAANQFLKVVECQNYAGLCPSFNGATRDSGGLQISITEPTNTTRYILEGSTNLLNWTKLMARTSAGATAQYTDTRATNYTRRFYRLVVP